MEFLQNHPKLTITLIAIIWLGSDAIVNFLVPIPTH